MNWQNTTVNMCNSHDFKCLWDMIHSQTNYLVLSNKKGKNYPMVPPLDNFQWKNRNRSSLARMISASRRSFFANLTTFERHSGLKKFSLLKITILKMGWLSKFQSHRSWGDAHISLGTAQAPPNYNGIDLRLINFDNHPIFKIPNWLLLFLFLLLLQLDLGQKMIWVHLGPYNSWAKIMS